MEIKWLIFIIVGVSVAYFLGWYIGKKHGLNTFLRGIEGTRLVTDKETEEVASLTFYYDYDLFKHEMERLEQEAKSSENETYDVYMEKETEDKEDTESVPPESDED
jgi:hypothetical protein